MWEHQSAMMRRQQLGYQAAAHASAQSRPGASSLSPAMCALSPSCLHLPMAGMVLSNEDAMGAGSSAPSLEQVPNMLSAHLGASAAFLPPGMPMPLGSPMLAEGSPQ